MQGLSNYNDYIQKSVLANNEFGIKHIEAIEDLKSLCLVREEYPKIVELIKKKDIEAIRNLKPSSVKTSEYLSIIKIIDDEGKVYVVTGYDSDDLSQDPQVIDIFPMQ